MNELRRMAYLEAMGIPGYVSRAQLPGAATTRRLAIVTSRSCEPAVMPLDPPAVPPPPLARPLPRVESAPRRVARTRASAAIEPLAEVPRFSLAAVVCEDWLWLEELDGLPLAREQVQLVEAMTRALQRAIGQSADVPAGESRPGPARPGQARPGQARPGQAHPQVTLFDWPIHNNRQLDQGKDAAQAGVAGFVGRKLEQHQCRALVLLGQRCAQRLPLEQFDGVPVGRTLSSASMLAEPGLKKQAWIDLLAFAARL